MEPAHHPSASSIAVSANFGELVLFALAILGGLAAPMTVVEFPS